MRLAMTDQQVLQQNSKRPAGKKKTFKKREKKVVPQGVVHIQASFNNTLISITDLQAISSRNRRRVRWDFADRAKARLLPRSRPLSRQQISRVIAECALAKCASRGRVRDANRQSAPSSQAGIEVRIIRDVTPIPHNGCRPPKDAGGHVSESLTGGR